MVILSLNSSVFAVYRQFIGSWRVLIKYNYPGSGEEPVFLDGLFWPRGMSMFFST
jgi:hypothetical protein